MSKAAAAKSAPEWIPKLEAAKLLGVKPRQLERRCQQGFIDSRFALRLPTETQARALYSVADILALKAGNPNVHAREVPAKSAVSTALARAAQPTPHTPDQRSEALALTVLREFIARTLPPPPPRPWLTLNEAAEYSGLPKSLLYKLARGKDAPVGNHMLRIRVINVGTNKRAAWRFRRDSLGSPGYSA